LEDEDESKSKKENPLLKGAKAKIPNLNLFDQKIKQLKNIQSEINKINTPIEIAWLKFNLQPLKNSLNNKVLAWINVFTSFLAVQFKTTLKNLKKFI
jgi:dynein heavy chain